MEETRAPGKECPKCKHEMEINTSKYCNVGIWLCPNCGEEIYKEITVVRRNI